MRWAIFENNFPLLATTLQSPSKVQRYTEKNIVSIEFRFHIIVSHFVRKYPLFNFNDPFLKKISHCAQAKPAFGIWERVYSCTCIPKTWQIETRQRNGVRTRYCSDGSNCFINSIIEPKLVSTKTMSIWYIIAKYNLYSTWRDWLSLTYFISDDL